MVLAIGLYADNPIFLLGGTFGSNADEDELVFFFDANRVSGGR